METVRCAENPKLTFPLNGTNVRPMAAPSAKSEQYGPDPCQTFLYFWYAGIPQIKGWEAFFLNASFQFSPAVQASSKPMLRSTVPSTLPDPKRLWNTVWWFIWSEQLAQARVHLNDTSLDCPSLTLNVLA